MTTDSAPSTPVIQDAPSETRVHEEPHTEPVAHLQQQAPAVEGVPVPPVLETERVSVEHITDGAAADTDQPTAVTKDGDASTQNAERDKEIVEEFEYLLEKSQQLFSGLSDLPEIGSKYWMPHFQRTFEVYTKLWKYQTQHRVLLEKPEHYGLKRWEVGEIASKIGQLYYRYYLRTSETNYLQEAYMFYDAIRERSYFKGEQEVKNSALMIKKLRYYARFIMVCLQMNNAPMMLQLLEEVKALIDIYSTTFNPVDKMEWSLVVKEMAMFMQAVCSPVPSNHSGTASLPVSYRLVARRRPRPEKDGSKFRLQEAVIVGNRPTQIKFSELTLDMYYMLQMLEREPSTSTKEAVTGSSATPAILAATETAEGSTAGIADGSAADTPEAPETVTDTGGAGAVGGKGKAAIKDKVEPSERDKDAVEKERPGRRVNPHKYVLYQPNFSQIQVYLANAFREIGEQGCVLLYLSSEGASTEVPDTANGAAAHGYIGGIATARRSSGEAAKDRSAEQLINSVHPADLVPYTRKPFFLVVESESSWAYKDMPNLFNQPLLCLLSPIEYPITSSSGSIYTFFLHSPIVAFCVVSQIKSMAAEQWSELETLFIEFEDLALELLNTYVSSQVRKFLGDDFLRQIVIRHVLCCVLLDLHLEFVRPEHMPQSSPERFQDVVTAPVLLRKARDIIELCSVEDRYRMSDRSPTPPAKPPSPPPTLEQVPPASPQSVTGDSSANDHQASPSTVRIFRQHYTRQVGYSSARDIAPNPHTMDPMVWTFEELGLRAMNGLPLAAEYDPDTVRQQRSSSATVGQRPRIRTFDEAVNGAGHMFGDDNDAQLLADPDYLEYADNPRRSSRRRTQRVLLNVQPHEPVPAPPMADRRISLRSLTNGLGSANRSFGSSQADSATSSRRVSSNTGTPRISRSQHSRKRRNTSRSDSSSPPVESMDSDLSVEVCIYTQGTAVPHNVSPPSESTQTCFICSNTIDGDMDAVNAHIDNCLAQSTDAAASAHEPMVEYEWSGQRRVRATAMVEGGLVAAGIGHSSSMSLHNDDDIDVDAEDETNFGAAQYSDSNLLFASSSSSANRKGSRRDDRQAHQLANPQFEEFAPSLEDEPESPAAAVAGWQQATGGSQLIIEALKARIREQDRLLQSVQKCLICLEPYEKPCTSINCWHVYCETCWLHTLGTKKLCPQCQQITQPTDLRRVYL
ncbi:hypothetical protein GGI17_001217 [Coemansia sp. S146]|nr:hypothetical protein GGI17_001217 [Coemansia sp. S146]